MQTFLMEKTKRCENGFFLQMLLQLKHMLTQALKMQDT